MEKQPEESLIEWDEWIGEHFQGMRTQDLNSHLGDGRETSCPATEYWAVFTICVSNGAKDHLPPSQVSILQQFKY